jgi:hypothetical protein
MGFLDWFFKPKQAVGPTKRQRFCAGYSNRVQLNSVTADGRRGVCPVCGKNNRRTKTGTSFWHSGPQ